MDPQQELFAELLTKLREWGYDVYDGALPPENTPYPFVYLADSQQIDEANKTAVFGSVYQTGDRIDPIAGNQGHLPENRTHEKFCLVCGKCESENRNGHHDQRAADARSVGCGVSVQLGGKFMRNSKLQLFAEAIQGKKIVYLYRVKEDAATANAEGIAFTTENGRTKSKDADSTATKDGSIRTPGVAEVEITASGRAVCRSKMASKNRIMPSGTMKKPVKRVTFCMEVISSE